MDLERVGRSCNGENHLKNSYFKTPSGLYVPEVYCGFFGDSFAHALCGMWSVVTHAQIDDLPEEMKPMSNQEVHDKEVLRLQKTVDEVLAIADPKSSYGLVDVQGREGFYNPLTTGFMNSTTLHMLYVLSSGQHFDYDKRQPTERFATLNMFWEDLLHCCNAFFAKRCTQDEIMITPKFKDILEHS